MYADIDIHIYMSAAAQIYSVTKRPQIAVPERKRYGLYVLGFMKFIDPGSSTSKSPEQYSPDYYKRNKEPKMIQQIASQYPSIRKQLAILA